MKIAIALVGAALLLIAFTPMSSGTPKRPSVSQCAPRSSRALLADRRAQVYQYREALYACSRRSRRKIYLGHSEEPAPCGEHPALGCGAVSNEALAGDVVAYAEKPLGYAQRVVVRHISTGGVLHNVSLYVTVVERTLVEEARAVRLVANRRGMVAWVQEDSYVRHGGGVPPRAVYDVFAADTHGFRPLRTALPSEPKSLTLKGNTLLWIQAGARQSVQLS